MVKESMILSLSGATTPKDLALSMTLVCGMMAALAMTVLALFSKRKVYIFSLMLKLRLISTMSLCALGIPLILNS